MAVLVLAGTGIVLALGGSGGDDGAAPGAPASSEDSVAGSAETPVFEADTARAFESALNSRDPEALVEVLAVGEFDPKDVAEQALPAGSTIAIEESSFLEGDDGGFATVDASIDGEVTATVTLFLAIREGRWVMVGSTAPEGS
jgi:hypothetical protein